MDQPTLGHVASTHWLLLLWCCVLSLCPYAAVCSRMDLEDGSRSMDLEDGSRTDVMRPGVSGGNQSNALCCSESCFEQPA